jgi:hypothetical protein
VLGEISVTRSLVVLLGSGALTMALVWLLLFRDKPAAQRPPFEAELAAFVATLAHRGLPPEPGETPARLAARAAARWPAQAQQIGGLYRALARLVYGSPAPAADRRRLQREMRRRVRRLRLPR